MDISQYTYTELLQLKRKIDVELLFRRETSIAMTKEMNFIYGSELIDYINKSQNIDITKSKRKHVYTFATMNLIQDDLIKAIGNGTTLYFLHIKKYLLHVNLLLNTGTFKEHKLTNLQCLLFANTIYTLF